jgi:hypothetical protein
MLDVGFKLIRGKESCPDLVEPKDAGPKCPHQAKGHCYFCTLLMSGSVIWELTLKKDAPELRQTTIDCYMELSRDALMWTKDMHPQITDRTKQEAIAMTVMIMSPKPFVALLRNLHEMRPFGEYDKIKYLDRKKIGNGEQLELNFDKVLATFDVLDRLDEDFVLKLPEGKNEEEAFEELETKLQSALAKVQKRRGRTIEI